jgi:hypothetical protein
MRRHLLGDAARRGMGLGVASLTLILASCGPAAQDEKVEACVQRGITYFKEIESYPTLQSAPNAGRRAEDVARERCTRTSTAF